MNGTSSLGSTSRNRCMSTDESKRKNNANDEKRALKKSKNTSLSMEEAEIVSTFEERFEDHRKEVKIALEDLGKRMINYIDATVMKSLEHITRRLDECIVGSLITTDHQGNARELSHKPSEDNCAKDVHSSSSSTEPRGDSLSTSSNTLKTSNSINTSFAAPIRISEDPNKVYKSLNRTSDPPNRACEVSNTTSEITNKQSVEISQQRIPPLPGTIDVEVLNYAQKKTPFGSYFGMVNAITEKILTNSSEKVLGEKTNIEKVNSDDQTPTGRNKNSNIGERIIFGRDESAKFDTRILPEEYLNPNVYKKIVSGRAEKMFADKNKPENSELLKIEERIISPRSEKSKIGKGPSTGLKGIGVSSNDDIANSVEKTRTKGNKRIKVHRWQNSVEKSNTVDAPIISESPKYIESANAEKTIIEKIDKMDIGMQPTKSSQTGGIIKNPRIIPDAKGYHIVHEHTAESKAIEEVKNHGEVKGDGKSKISYLLNEKGKIPQFSKLSQPSYENEKLTEKKSNIVMINSGEKPKLSIPITEKTRLLEESKSCGNLKLNELPINGSNTVHEIIDSILKTKRMTKSTVIVPSFQESKTIDKTPDTKKPQILEHEVSVKLGRFSTETPKTIEERLQNEKSEMSNHSGNFKLIEPITKKLDIILDSEMINIAEKSKLSNSFIEKAKFTNEELHTKEPYASEEPKLNGKEAIYENSMELECFIPMPSTKESNVTKANEIEKTLSIVTYNKQSQSVGVSFHSETSKAVEADGNTEKSKLSKTYQEVLYEIAKIADRSTVDEHRRKYTILDANERAEIKRKKANILIERVKVFEKMPNLPAFHNGKQILDNLKQQNFRPLLRTHGKPIDPAKLPQNWTEWDLTGLTFPPKVTDSEVDNQMDPLEVIDLNKQSDDDESNMNECAICDKFGQLIQCDDCPRSYHFKCLKREAHEIGLFIQSKSLLPDPWTCFRCKKENNPSLEGTTLTEKLSSLQALLENNSLISSHFLNPVDDTMCPLYRHHIKKPQCLKYARNFLDERRKGRSENPDSGPPGPSVRAFAVKYLNILADIVTNCQDFNRPKTVIYGCSLVMQRIILVAYARYISNDLLSSDRAALEKVGYPSKSGDLKLTEVKQDL